MCEEDKIKSEHWNQHKYMKNFQSNNYIYKNIVKLWFLFKYCYAEKTICWHDSGRTAQLFLYLHSLLE